MIKVNVKGMGAIMGVHGTGNVKSTRVIHKDEITDIHPLITFLSKTEKDGCLLYVAAWNHTQAKFLSYEYLEKYHPFILWREMNWETKLKFDSRKKAGYELIAANLVHPIVLFCKIEQSFIDSLIPVLKTDDDGNWQTFYKTR
jgi:hypothetical protein